MAKEAAGDPRRRFPWLFAMSEERWLESEEGQAELARLRDNDPDLVELELSLAATICGSKPMKKAAFSQL